MNVDWKTIVAIAVLVGGWVWTAGALVGQIQNHESSLAVLYAEKDKVTAWRAATEPKLDLISRVAADLAEIQSAELRNCRKATKEGK